MPQKDDTMTDEPKPDRKRTRSSSADMSGHESEEEYDEFGRVIQVGGAEPKRPRRAEPKKSPVKERVAPPQTKSIGIQIDLEPESEATDTVSEALEQEVRQQRLKLQILNQRLAEEKRRRKRAQTQQSETAEQWAADLAKCQSINQGLKTEVKALADTLAKIQGQWNRLQTAGTENT